MGDLTPFRRKSRFRLPAAWQPYLRRRGLSVAQVRIMIWTGLLLGLLFWQALRFQPAPSLEPGFAPAEISTPGAGPLSGPARVIDGDTFDYGGIRIADIDTPEVRGQCPYETQLAARATQRMRALLAAGPFELHALGNGRDEDRYGRKLRIVTRGGR